MKSSLITERPLLVSPTLAATIGLEEAIMLQALSEFSSFNLIKSAVGSDDPNAFTVTKDQIKAFFPFWKEKEIDRIQDSLVAMGVITIQKDKVDTKLTIEIKCLLRFKALQYKSGFAICPLAPWLKSLKFLLNFGTC